VLLGPEDDGGQGRWIAEPPERVVLFQNHIEVSAAPLLLLLVLGRYYAPKVLCVATKPFHHACPMLR
jgi:hypothetical protein